MSEVDGNGLVGDDHTLAHTVQLSIDAIEDGNDYFLTHTFILHGRQRN